MYEEFFGLRERPFDLSPNPRFLFLADIHREALSTLRYGLGGPRGLTLLLGDAGTGKTTLVRTVLEETGPDTVECVLLSNPTLTRAEFYEALAEGFHFDPAVGASKTRFLAELRQHLEARQARGQLTALLLDEAQSLPYELLEEVRLLSNMETPATKLLNVVLAGQPELADRLNEPRLRQLKQRIALRCHLRPFGGEETAFYVASRLRVVGGTPADIFTQDAVDAVFAASGGLPRVINVICDNALIGGFAAGVKPVSRAIVDEVIRDFDLGAGGRARAAAAPDPLPVRAVAPAAPPAVEVTPMQVRVPAPVPAADERVDADTEAEAGTGDGLFSMFGRRKRFSFF